MQNSSQVRSEHTTFRTPEGIALLADAKLRSRAVLEVYSNPNTSMNDMADLDSLYNGQLRIASESKNTALMIQIQLELLTIKYDFTPLEHNSTARRELVIGLAELAASYEEKFSEVTTLKQHRHPISDENLEFIAAYSELMTLLALNLAEEFIAVPALPFENFGENGATNSDGTLHAYDSSMQFQIKAGFNKPKVGEIEPRHYDIPMIERVAKILLSQLNDGIPKVIRSNGTYSMKLHSTAKSAGVLFESVLGVYQTLLVLAFKQVHPELFPDIDPKEASALGKSIACVFFDGIKSKTS
jgi:hypothetical protein